MTASNEELLALPALPDDDTDFTPDLARKIIEKYQAIVSRLAAQSGGEVRVEWEEGKGNFAGQFVWSSGNPWEFWIVKNPDDQGYVWCENFNIEGWCPASPVRGSFSTLDAA